MLPPLISIIGPTASGKSDLAVRLALTLADRGCPAEIVNSDSMLIYRGMDIGTAKPTSAQRRGVPHHLIDIADPQHTATVADFQQLARAAIATLRDRGVLPIMVGGSSLYVRAIVDDFDFPGTDPTIRSRWEAELARVGAETLHAELAKRSAEAAAGILPGNGRRIVRALEVIDLTGAFSSTLPGYTYFLENVHQFGIWIERDEMDARIAARVHRMWADGFVDEVRQLERQGLRNGLTASRALGYQQVLSYLAGELEEHEALQATIDGTRRFARKQLGWFRRDPRIDWLHPDHGDPVRTVLADPAIGTWQPRSATGGQPHGGIIEP